MSTNKTLKRIALVAVASLGFGLVSVAPSNAAATIAYDNTLMYDATNGYQIVGGLAKVNVTPDNSTTYSVSVSGGSVVSMTSTGGDKLNGVADTTVNAPTTAVSFETDATASTLAIIVTSAAVADVVISVTPYNANGSLGTAVTKTVKFIAKSSLDLASIQVTTLPGDDAANCALANKANAAHDSVTFQDSDDTTNSAATDIDICVLAFNGLGGLYTGTAVVTIAGNGKGLVGGVATVSSSETDGIYQAGVTGNGLSGLGVFTVSVTATNADATTVAKSDSVEIKFYGELTKLTLTNKAYALDDSAAATDAITVAAEDENGYPVPLDLTADDEFMIDSDIASTTVIDAANEEDAAGALTVSNDGTVSALGVATSAIVDWDPAATSFEKVAFTAVVTNANGVKVTSNTVYVYTTDDAALTPSVTVADGIAGASQTLSASVLADTDDKSYPVADGETVTFATSGGALSASTATTKNGVASVTLYNSAVSGDYTVTATADTLQGSKTFKVTGGLGDAVEAAADAAAEAIDAANAATDAANLAAEAADAATVAAEEARDAADAATAAVEELATQVATLMAALKAQLTTLANTVAKIAKKVRA